MTQPPSRTWPPGVMHHPTRHVDASPPARPPLWRRASVYVAVSVAALVVCVSLSLSYTVGFFEATSLSAVFAWGAGSFAAALVVSGVVFAVRHRRQDAFLRGRIALLSLVLAALVPLLLGGQYAWQSSQEDTIAARLAAQPVPDGWSPGLFPGSIHRRDAGKFEPVFAGRALRHPGALDCAAARSLITYWDAHPAEISSVGNACTFIGRYKGIRVRVTATWHAGDADTQVSIVVGNPH